MKRHILLVNILILIIIPSYGQISIDDAIKPPLLDLGFFREDSSPQVAMMNRYGTYPVDLTNGLVDVSVPLYTIKMATLSLPLQLKFHASGLKSSEREGLLGVRWVLDSGGFISRIIRGYPDMGERSFNRKVSNPEYTPDFYDLYGTTGPQSVYNSYNNSAFLSGFSYNGITYRAGKYQDTEHDIFSYCLPSGRNGKFIWKATGDNDNIWKGYPMPYEPIEVAPTGITDENGVVYKFGERGYVDKDKDNNIVTWHLTSIISQNKMDTILIDYIRCGDVTTIREKTITITDNASYYQYTIPTDGANACNTEPKVWFLAEQLLGGYYKENIEGHDTANDIPYCISAIRARSGGHLVCKLDLNYEQAGLGRNIYLKEIIVRNLENEIVRTILFDVKRNKNGTGFLNKLALGGNKQDAKEIYTFDYYNWEVMPRCGEELSYNSDWWGYYSSGGGWVHSGALKIYLPDQTLINKTIGAGDKEPRFSSMVMGMIKSICYPTGGKTTFEYEGNSWFDIYQKKQVTYGGLRIKNMTNTLPSGKIETKTFEYAPGIVPFYLNPPSENWIISQIEVDCYFDYICAINKPSTADYVRRTFQSRFPSRYTDLLSNVVSYSRITEYDKDQNENILGKTEYVYSCPDREFYSRTYYENVSGTEFYGRFGFQLRHISPMNFWLKNNISSKIYYKCGMKVKEKMYRYKTYIKERIYDLPVYRYRTHNVLVNRNGTSEQQEILMIYPHNVNETFALKHQAYTIGAERMVKEIENTYYGDESMTSVEKEIEYDPVHLLPVKEVITNSDTAKVETSYIYPFSSLYSSQDVCGEMLKRNCLSPLIEKLIVRDGHINRLKTTYKKNGNGFYPNEVKYENYGISINYHEYSLIGQPVYLSQNSESEKVIYLWSYYHQYPIAEIRNVSYNILCDALGGEGYIMELANKMSPLNQDFEKIRNVRNIIPDALISTARYKPLVGVIETTDTKGLTTFYEYDTLGRLISTYIIKGTKKQVLEKYNYHNINQ